MSDVTFGRRIYYLESVTSTQDFLKERFEQGAAEGTVVISLEQTAGRGRIGHSWYSPAGKGLWMSVLLEPEGPLEDWTWVPLWAGVVMRRAISGLFGASSELDAKDILLKWPNDIIFRERKLGGILAETVRNSRENQAVILGIGINLLQREEEFPAHLQEKSCSVLSACGETHSPDDLLATVLQSLQDSHPLLKPVNKAVIEELWLEAAWEHGAKLSVQSGDQRYKGVFTGLGPHGEMCLQPEGKAPVFLSSADAIQRIEVL
jgi:BirA family biotin operon repressor/biotin-[acetyl-CoA-carboxylase] ligase